MRVTQKPVRKCYSCLLNLGDRCWLYDNPHDQWHRLHRCPGFGNQALHAEFQAWQLKPRHVTPRQQRRERFAQQCRTEEHHNHFVAGIGPLR